MGFRLVLVFVVVIVALLIEYAFSDGGALRWIESRIAPAPARIQPAAAPPEVARPAAPAPQARPEPRPQPATPRPQPRPEPAEPRFGSLPLETSFESEDSQWVFDARGGDGIGARSSDVARTGAYSLFSQAGEAANRGWPGWEHGTRYAVKPGQAYVFRASAVSPDGANAWLDLQLFDANGTWLGGRSSGCLKGRPGRNWEAMQLRYVNNDPRVASVQPGLLQCLNHTRGRTTTLFFDDVSFRPE